MGVTLLDEMGTGLLQFKRTVLSISIAAFAQRLTPQSSILCSRSQIPAFNSRLVSPVMHVAWNPPRCRSWMVKAIYLLCCLQLFNLPISARGSLKQAHVLNRDVMTNKLEAFFDSLALPSFQAQSLSNALAGDSNLKAFLDGSSYSSSDLVGSACKVAQAALGSDVVQIQPVGATEIDLNWSQTCWAAPTCVVLPRSSQDISRTLKIINFFQVKFAVRSGGHSPNPGWSSINNPGLLIDLQRFNEVTVNSDRSVASLGPGGRWGDVYAALDPYGVSVIGGRIPHVGVGGLILGGLSSSKRITDQYDDMYPKVAFFISRENMVLLRIMSRTTRYENWTLSVMFLLLTNMTGCPCRWNDHRCERTTEQ